MQSGMCRHHLRRTVFACIFLLLPFALPRAGGPDAWAITITRTLAGGTAPGNTTGTGNLLSIFNVAADLWEAALLDAHAVTINFSWGALSGAELAGHGLVTQGGEPNRETSGSIVFDNDGSSVWFMDPTPLLNNEYGSFAASSANLGGGVINTGRVSSTAVGDAAGRIDLFSVALHEIAHALGLSSGNTSFLAENGDVDIGVMAPRPFPGTAIPTVSGAHLAISTALMYPAISPGIRKGASAVDILANCQISQFTACNLDPAVVVPEPSSILLFLSCALGLGAMMRREHGGGT